MVEGGKEQLCCRSHGGPAWHSSATRVTVIHSPAVLRSHSAHTLSLADWARAWEMDSFMRWSFRSR